MAGWAFADRREAVGVVGSIIFVVAGALLAGLTPDRVVPSVIVLIGPLTACTAARPRWTAVVSVVAFACGSFLVFTDDLPAFGEVARIAILAFVAVLAVWLSRERVRREVSAAASAARQQFVDLAEASADLIGMVSSTSATHYLNPAGLAMIGLSTLEELSAIEPIDVVAPQHQETIEQLSVALERDGMWLGETQLRRVDDGVLVDVELLAFEMSRRPDYLVAVVCRDISSRKRHTADLEMSELRYRTLVDATSAVTWTTDIDGRIVEPQPSWSAFTGQTEAAYEGFGWSDVMHPDDVDMVWERWRQSVETASFYSSEPRLWHAPSQTYRRVLVTGAPVLDEGGQLASWFGAVLDIEDRRRAERLAGEAADRLNLIMQAAPVGIAFLGPDLRYLVLNERYAELDRVPLDDHVGLSIAEATPTVAPSLYPLILRVFTSGLPLLDVEIEAGFGPGSGSPDRWLVNAVPVEDVGGERVGVGLAIIDVTDRHHRESELLAAFEERDRIARALQNALLPPELPTIEGVEVTAQYLPAGGGAEVGGDFYDVMQDGGGRWHVVIGDVCGKGPDAAALTGLARHTLRAAAIGSAEPVELLRLVNEALRRANTDRFLTLVDLMLDGSGERLTVTTVLAGHPPPLLLRDGEVRELGSYGVLLGVFDQVRLEPTTEILQPGDVVVAYTDGLIEHQGPPPFGEPEFRALLASCAGLDGEETAERIAQRLTELRAAESGEDDVAYLVLAVPATVSTPTGARGRMGSEREDVDEERVSSAEFDADSTSPRAARTFIRDVLNSWSCPDETELAQLLVSELVGNAVQHARSAVTVTVSLSGERVRVEVADRDPSPPVERHGGPFAPNGRGLMILDALSASWGYAEREVGPGKIVWFEMPVSANGAG